MVVICEIYLSVYYKITEAFFIQLLIIIMSKQSEYKIARW